MQETEQTLRKLGSKGPPGKNIDSSRGSCEGQSQVPTLGSWGQRSPRGLRDSAVAMNTGPHRVLHCGHRTLDAAKVIVIFRHQNRLCPAPASSKYQLPHPSRGRCTRRLAPSSVFKEGWARETGTFSSAVTAGSAQAGEGASEGGRSAALAGSGVPVPSSFPQPAGSVTRRPVCFPGYMVVLAWLS